MQKHLLFSATLLLLLTAAYGQNNVGIGTNAPASKLDVKGNITIGNTYSGTTAPANGAIIEGKVGIGTNAPNSKAVLDVTSTNAGMLIPRLSNIQRAALTPTLTAAEDGLLIYNSDDKRAQYWDGALLSWKDIGSGVGGPPTGAAGGDLTGTYPNPNIGTGKVTSTHILDGTITNADIAAGTIDLTSKVTNALPVANGGTGRNSLDLNTVLVGNTTSPVKMIAVNNPADVLIGNASGVPTFTAISNDATLSSTGALTLANTGVIAATYGSATTVPQIAVDSKGRITSATAVTITGTTPGGSAGGDLTGTYPNPTIGNDKVTAAAIATDAVGSTEIAAGAVGTSEIADGTVANADLAGMAALSVKGNATNTLGASPTDIAAAADNQVLRRSGTALGFGAINLASSAAVTGTLPAANGGTGLSAIGTSNQLLGVNNAGNALEYKTISTSGTAVSNDVGVTLTGANATVINLPSASSTVRGVLTAADWATFNGKQGALTFSTGLTNSSGTVTANLSTGIAGGQTAIGGTASGNNLTLSSTTNATKGKILFGTSAYDEVNQRLGINTATPGAKLDIAGGADNTGANDQYDIALQYRTGGYRHFIRSRHNSAVTTDGNDIDFYVNNGTTAAASSAPGTGNIHVLTMESNNGTPRVGIGTTAPTYPLDVYVAPGGWKAIFRGTDGYIQMGPANSSWAHIYTDRPNFIFNQNVWSIPGGFSSYNTADLALQTNGTTRVTALNSNGNVGVATTTPPAKLTVLGASAVSAIPGATTNAAFRVAVGASEGLDFGKSTASPYSAWIQSGFGGTTADPLVIQPDGGNVGIGTFSPSDKLDVRGNVLSLGTKVVNGAVSTYNVSTRRYFVKITYGTYAGATYPLDMTIINDLCGDEDGCQVRLVMRYWSGTEPEGASDSAPGGYFTYDNASGRWRWNGTSGIDGNGAVEHILNIYNACYFTDGTYVSSSGSDPAGRQLGLLAWTSAYTNSARTCELTITD